MACKVLSLSDSETVACEAAANAGAGTAGTVLFGRVAVVAAESGSAHAQAASNPNVTKIFTGLAPSLADRARAAAGSAACRWKFVYSALPFQKSRWRARRRKPARSRI